MSSDEEVAPRRKRNIRLIRDEDENGDSEAASSEESSVDDEGGLVNMDVEDDEGSGEDESESSEEDEEDEEESEWEEIPQELLLEGRCQQSASPSKPNVTNGSTTVADSDSDSNLSDAQAERCPVCLNRFLGQEVGTPESCDHAFCLDCIQEWAKNMNTCPVDRSVFKLILVRKGEKVIRRLALDKPNKDEEAVQEDLTYCEVCGACDREDRLLLCDGCDLGYHCECLTPPLEEVPIEEWYCPECAPEHSTRLEDAMPEDVLHDFHEMLEGRFRMGARRAIARTRASEIVRTRIERRRAAESGVTSPPRSSTRAPSNGRRRTVRRRRRRRTKASKSSKTKSGKTKSGKTSSRKRRTKKHRRRKRKHRTSLRSRQSARPLSKPPSVRQRIAEKLGLRKPPPGHCLPLMNRTDLTATGYADCSVSSLSIFGDRDELVSLDDSGDDGSTDVLTVRRTHHRVTPSHVKQKLLKPTPPLDRIRMALAKPSTAPSCGDVLGSILATQRVLLGRHTTRHAIIQRDGSLDLRSVPLSAVQSRPRSPGSSTASSPPPSGVGGKSPSAPNQLGGNSAALVGTGDSVCRSGVLFSGEDPPRDCGGGQAVADCVLPNKGKEVSKNGMGAGDSEDEVDIYSDIESIGEDQQGRGQEPETSSFDGPVMKVIPDSHKRADDDGGSGDDSSENELVIDEEENGRNEDEVAPSPDSVSSPSPIAADKSADRHNDQQESDEEEEEEEEPVRNGNDSEDDENSKEDKVPSQIDQKTESPELAAKSLSSPGKTSEEGAFPASSPLEAVETDDSDASAPSSPIDVNDRGVAMSPTALRATRGNEKVKGDDSARSSPIDVEDVGEDAPSPVSSADPNEKVEGSAPSSLVDANEVAEHSARSSLVDANEKDEVSPPPSPVDANEAAEISPPSSPADVNEKCEGSPVSSTVDENEKAEEEADEVGDDGETAVSSPKEIESPEGNEEAEPVEIESPPAQEAEPVDNLLGAAVTEDITSPEYEPSVHDGEEEEEGLLSEQSRDGIEEVSEPGSGDELFGGGAELQEPEPVREEPRRSKGKSCHRHKHRRRRRSHDEEREEGEIVEESSSSRRKKIQDEMDEYMDAGPRINISELPRIPKLKRVQDIGREATPDSKRTSVLGRVDAGSSSEISWKKLSKHSRERIYRDGKHKDEKLMFKEREIRKKEKDRRLQEKNKKEEEQKPKKERKPDRELYVRPDKRRDWSRKEKTSSSSSSSQKERKDKHKDKYSSRHSSKDRHSSRDRHSSKDRQSSKDARCDSKDRRDRHSGRRKRSSDRSKDRSGDRSERTSERKHKEHKESKRSDERESRKDDRNVRRMEEKAKAILEKKEKEYWKEKHEKRAKHKEHSPSPAVEGATPIEHKEVFTKGNSIIINVNFNRKADAKGIHHDEIKESRSRKRVPSPDEEVSARKRACSSSNHYDSDSKDDDDIEEIIEVDSDSPADNFGYDNHASSESEYEEEAETVSHAAESPVEEKKKIREPSPDPMPPPAVPAQSPPRSPRSPSPPSPPEDNSYDPCEPTKSPSPPPPADPVPPPEPELPPLPPEPEPDPKVVRPAPSRPVMIRPATPPAVTYANHVQLPSLHMPPPSYVLPPRTLPALVASLRAPWPAGPMFAPSHLLGLRGAFAAPTTLLGPPVGILPPHAAVAMAMAPQPTMILPPENVAKPQPEITEVVDMEVDSPYSPPDSPVGAAAQENERKISSFDTLLPARTGREPTKGSHKKHRSGSKERKQIVHFMMEKGVRAKAAETKGRMDETQLKVLDELPSSAVEMQVKEKFLKKLNRQERVVEEVKLSLKPYYNRREITKEEYKDVLRKSVPKICHNKSGEINPVKIRALVEGYVKKVKYHRKKPSSTHKSKATS
ncbi:PHD and RING finger domain-containing protein 1-like isoform X2 [Ornithodoros turicata]